jgi:catechol 2,3-dioxygenase-like lactoylglutathione lyase family enzyme
MLGDKRIDPVLLAPDLAESRDFYARRLGLEIISENDSTVIFRCGGDSRLILSASATGTADEQTQVTWRVDDLAAELAELRSHGVEPMDYDLDGLKTENGIFDAGDALHAWIVDPGKNTLGIDQPKEVGGAADEALIRRAGAP